MDIDAAFPSTYLKPADLPEGREAAVVIASVEVREFDDGSKPCLAFENRSKMMLLNRTNATTIAEAYGRQTENWIGRQVILFRTMTDYAGKRVPCIRVRVANARAAAEAPPPAAHRSPPPASNGSDFPGDRPSAGHQFTDEIPFAPEWR